MTSTTVTTLEQAALPTAIAVLQAFQTFVSNMGTDPAQFAAKFPGAVQVFLGSVELQAPTLVVSEITALQSTVNSKVSGWISSLQAKQAAPSSGTTAINMSTSAPAIPA